MWLNCIGPACKLLQVSDAEKEPNKETLYLVAKVICTFFLRSQIAIQLFLFHIQLFSFYLDSFQVKLI